MHSKYIVSIQWKDIYYNLNVWETEIKFKVQSKCQGKSWMSQAFLPHPNWATPGNIEAGLQWINSYVEFINFLFIYKRERNKQTTSSYHSYHHLHCSLWHRSICVKSKGKCNEDFTVNEIVWSPLFNEWINCRYGGVRGYCHCTL